MLTFTVRTLIAGQSTDLQADPSETLGTLRARATAALQLPSTRSRLLCLGAPLSDAAPLCDVRAPQLLLLPLKPRAVAAAAPDSRPAPAPCTAAPADAERSSGAAALEDLLSDVREAAVRNALPLEATLDDAVRSWGGDDKALLAALEQPAPSAEAGGGKRRKASAAKATASKRTRSPPTPAWWQDAALAALPLPPELATLHQQFSFVSLRCAFLRTQRFTATARTAAEALQVSEEQARERLAAMAALAPGLVRLRRLALSVDEGDEQITGDELAVEIMDPARVRDVRVAAWEGGNDTDGHATLVQGARRAASLGPAAAARRGAHGWDAPSTAAAAELATRQRTAFYACCVHACALVQQRGGWDAVQHGTWHVRLPAPTLKGALAACAERAAPVAGLGASPVPAAAALACDARRCRDRALLEASAFLEHLRAGLGSRGNIVHVEALPARAARYADLPSHAALPSAVHAAFGLDAGRRLYVHQAAALTAFAEGRHVVVSTATSSGKSLCYLAPCLAAAAAGGTALLLFPTKALAQDQLRALNALLAAPYPSPPLCGVYDGDTPEAERAMLRGGAQVLLSNPDMLHCGVLPAHASFAHFLSRLTVVAVDEAHAYGGAFGAHAALVLRRLRRLAERYGSSPRFVFTSATVASPAALAPLLAGLDGADVALVQDDGSPAGAKDVVLWNPPLLHGAQAAAADEDLVPDAPPEPKLHRSKAKQAPQRRGKAAVAQSLRAAEAGCAPASTDGDTEQAVSQEQSARDWIEQRRAEQAARRQRATAPPPSAATAARTRASPIFEAALLLAECVQHGLAALAFCKSRKLSELVFMYARDVLADSAPDLVPLLASYRAGYTPEARRDLERRLFSGQLRGVAATNALELGVDVGALDVVITLGFPGSVASLWQQSGRAGRREQRALHFYVAFDSPLDASLFARPAWLFSRRPEAAALDPSNALVLAAHAACAAYEAPLHEEHDVRFFGPGLASAIRELRASGRLGRAVADSTRPDGAWAFVGAEAAKGGPARGINLRAVDEHTWNVVDEASREVVEVLEASRAFFAVYEGAVLLHCGRSYVCSAMEHGTRTARVRAADIKYYTAPVDSTRVTPAAGCAAGAAYAGGAHAGGAQLAPARVTTRVTGYTKRWRHSGVVFDAVDLRLPEVAWDTVAAWSRVPSTLARAAVAQLPPLPDAVLAAVELRLRGGMHAAAHALAAVLPLLVTCSAADVGMECGCWAHDGAAAPLRLLVFDKLAGGSGVSASAQPHFAALLAAALRLVEDCECGVVGGCVACVQSLSCSEYNALLDRPAAAAVLRVALAALREDANE